jgi:hypothetical protein
MLSSLLLSILQLGLRSGRIHLVHDLQPFLAALRRLGAVTLNPARQLLLPPHLDDGVLLGDLRVGVAGDLRGLDAAAADLLPRGDVGAAWRLRLGLRRNGRTCLG